jgi:hypothetical protein
MVGIVLHHDVAPPDSARRMGARTVAFAWRPLTARREMTMETGHTYTAHAAAVAQIERALRSTLDDIRSRVDTGAGHSTLAELVRHARDLANLLDQAVNRLEPDADAESMRQAAGDLLGNLRMLERDLASRVMH